MINTKTKLSVLTYISSLFADISSDASDSTRDTTDFILSDSDYVYIGFNKPINSFFVQLTAFNTNAAELSLDYYNGSTWTPVQGFLDDSKALSRSGFITWDRNQANEAMTVVSTTELYWYRISTNAILEEVTLQTITGLFSDDQDLMIEIPEITTAYMPSKTSHFNAHLAARNDIIQALRNQGNRTLNHSSGEDKDLTFWDILEIEQLKQASVYLALSKIFFNLSDQIDDKLSERTSFYYNKFEKAFKLAFLSIDKDDNGLKDTDEELPEVKSLRVTR